MYLRFSVEPSEFDASEFGKDDVIVRTDEIWGENIEIFAPVVEVTIDTDDRVTIIGFPDGSEIRDPSWPSWGVVALLPPYARAEQERQQGRIREMVEAHWPSD